MQDRNIGMDKAHAFMTPLPPTRILIVSQYHLGSAELAASLRKVGHVVEVVHDEQSALASERTFLPQLIIIDFEKRPGIDGNSLARAMRAQANRHLILASTSIACDGGNDSLEHEHFDDHMNWVKCENPFLMRRRKWLTWHDTAEGIIRRVSINCSDQFVVVMLAAAVCPCSPTELAPVIPDEYLQQIRSLAQSPEDFEDYLRDYEQRVFAEAEYWTDVRKGFGLWREFFKS